MRHIKGILLITGVVIALGALVLLGKAYFHKDTPAVFAVTSPVVQNGGTIPARYTCAADNLSLPLKFNNPPAQTKSMAVVLHDLDAPGGDYTHWLVWNIPPKTKSFNEGAIVTGATQGTTDFGTASYGGPCPLNGVHRYEIDGYALDTTLNLPSSARRDALEAAIKNHIVGKSTMLTSVAAKK